MTFELTIDMDNAAFEENPRELSDVLEHLAGMIEFVRLPIAHGSAGGVRDSNGNSVGSWKVKP
jgi:hypothetical protein